MLTLWSDPGYTRRLTVSCQHSLPHPAVTMNADSEPNDQYEPSDAHYEALQALPAQEKQLGLLSFRRYGEEWCRAMSRPVPKPTSELDAFLETADPISQRLVLHEKLVRAYSALGIQPPA